MSCQGYRQPSSHRSEPGNGANRIPLGPKHASRASNCSNYTAPSHYEPPRYPAAGFSSDRVSNLRSGDFAQDNADARAQSREDRLPLVERELIAALERQSKRRKRDQSQAGSWDGAPRPKDSSAHSSSSSRSLYDPVQLNPPLSWLKERPSNFRLPALRTYRLPFVPRNEKDALDQDRSANQRSGLGLESDGGVTLDSAMPQLVEVFYDEPVSTSSSGSSGNGEHAMLTLREKVVRSLQARKNGSGGGAPPVVAARAPIPRPVPIAPQPRMPATAGSLLNGFIFPQQLPTNGHHFAPPYQYASPEQHLKPMFYAPPHPGFMPVGFGHPFHQPVSHSHYLATPDLSPEFGHERSKFGFESGLVGDGEIVWDDEVEEDVLMTEEVVDTAMEDQVEEIRSTPSPSVPPRIASAEGAEIKRVVESAKEGAFDSRRIGLPNPASHAAHLPPPPPFLPQKPALLTRLSMPTDLPTAPRADRYAPPTAPRAMRKVSTSPIRVRPAGGPPPPTAPRAFFARQAALSLPPKPRDVFSKEMGSDEMPSPTETGGNSVGSSLASASRDFGSAPKTFDNPATDRQQPKSSRPAQTLSPKPSLHPRPASPESNSHAEADLRVSPLPPLDCAQFRPPIYARRRPRSPSHEGRETPPHLAERPPPALRRAASPCRLPSPRRSPSPRQVINSGVREPVFGAGLPARPPSPRRHPVPNHPSSRFRRRSASPPPRRQRVALSPEPRFAPPSIPRLRPSKMLEIQSAKMILEESVGSEDARSTTSAPSDLRRVFQTTAWHGGVKMTTGKQDEFNKGRGARGRMKSDSSVRLSTFEIELKRSKPMEVLDLTGDSDDEPSSGPAELDPICDNPPSKSVENEPNSPAHVAPDPRQRFYSLSNVMHDLAKRDSRAGPENHLDNRPRTLQYGSSPPPRGPPSPTTGGASAPSELDAGLGRIDLAGESEVKIAEEDVEMRGLRCEGGTLPLDVEGAVEAGTPPLPPVPFADAIVYANSSITPSEYNEDLKTALDPSVDVKSIDSVGPGKAEEVDSAQKAKKQWKAPWFARKTRTGAECGDEQVGSLESTAEEPEMMAKDDEGVLAEIESGT